MTAGWRQWQQSYPVLSDIVAMIHKSFDFALVEIHIRQHRPTLFSPFRFGRNKFGIHKSARCPDLLMFIAIFVFCVGIVLSRTNECERNC